MKQAKDGTLGRFLHDWFTGPFCKLLASNEMLDKAFRQTKTIHVARMILGVVSFFLQV